jgi:tetratricopeptide (TPR) repeat protein
VRIRLRRLIGLSLALPLTSAPSIVHAASVVEKSSVDRFALTARNLAAGRTGVSATDDPNALVDNPAGLATQSLRSVHLFTSDFDNGVKYYSLALSGQRLSRWGTLSAAYSRLDYGDIASRDTETSAPTDVAATDQAFLLGYGAPLWPRFGLMGGVSFRLRQAEIGPFSSNGVGADLGLMKAVSLWKSQRLNLGVVYQDALPLDVGFEEKAARKPGLQTGLAYEWSRQTGLLSGKGVLAVGANRFGAEYDLGMLALRLGVDAGDITTGMGVQFSRDDNTFGLDYGMAARDFATTHNMSLSWYFGVAKEEAARVERMRKWSARKLAKTAYKEANALAARKDYWAAKEKYEEAAAWMPDVEDYSERARKMERQAVAYELEKAVADYSARGRTLAAKGAKREAFIAWENVLLLDPQNLEAGKALDDLTAELTETQQKDARRQARTEQRDVLVDLAARIKQSLAQEDYAAAIRDWIRYSRLAHTREDLQTVTDGLRREIKRITDDRMEAAMDALNANRLRPASTDLRAVQTLSPNHPGLEHQIARLNQGVKLKKSTEGYERKKVLNEFSLAVRAFFQEKNYAKAQTHVEKVLEMDPTFEKAQELREKVRRIRSSK